MENPVAFDVHYTEFQRQTAWINANDWQLEKRTKQYRVRAALAKALISLANMLAPTKQETRTA